MLCSQVYSIKHAGVFRAESFWELVVHTKTTRGSIKVELRYW